MGRFTNCLSPSQRIYLNGHTNPNGPNPKPKPKPNKPNQTKPNQAAGLQKKQKPNTKYQNGELACVFCVFFLLSFFSFFLFFYRAGAFAFRTHTQNTLGQRRAGGIDCVLQVPSQVGARKPAGLGPARYSRATGGVLQGPPGGAVDGRASGRGARDKKLFFVFFLFFSFFCSFLPSFSHCAEHLITRLTAPSTAHWARASTSRSRAAPSLAPVDPWRAFDGVF